ASPMAARALTMGTRGNLTSSRCMRLATPVAKPRECLAKHDHGYEDEADDQHARDHLLPLGGGVLGRDEEMHEREHAGPTLAQPFQQTKPVSCERRLDERIPRGLPRSTLEWLRIVVQPERGATVLERGTPEQGGRCRPDRAVPCDRLGLEVRAESDQLGEVVDRLDGPDLLDPHESVGVEVVTEQERRIAVLGSEQPRPAEMQQIALVDRLDPERVARLGERRED